MTVRFMKGTSIAEEEREMPPAFYQISLRLLAEELPGSALTVRVGKLREEGEPYLLERGRGWPEFIESVLDRYNHTLEELNLLAYNLAQMTERQMEVYEGVLKVFPE